MKSDYILVFSIFSIPLVCLRKVKRDLNSSESVSDEESDTYRAFELDLTGNIRRHFAIDVVSSDLKNNVVCSPLTAMLPLGKMAYGAENGTTREILDATGIKSKTRLGHTFRKIIKNLQNLPGVTLNLASGLFVSNKLKIQEKFVKKTTKTFNSFVQQINCSDGDVAKQINQWVCDNTKSKIPNIITNSEQITCSDTSLIVINAVYFKGIWQKPFHRTKMKDFHSRLGVKKVPMMIVNDIFMYAKSNILNAEMVEIPYNNSRASLIVVLPYSKDGLPAVLRHLKQTPTLLNSAIKTLRPKDLLLAIPKFKLTTKIDLKNLYEKVGVKKAIDPKNSGLCNIVQDKTLYISKAIQETVLEVTEKGTDDEFTEVEDTNHIISMTLDQIILFADHPFLFFVTANREQLFAGIYNGVGTK